mmetsp:Transcript_26888/g.58797  ORF Transcript_26888/g.58797 Transcript_26888/m.58797 type:complete len:127 (+) Transcript_26888:253-633(+)
MTEYMYWPKGIDLMIMNDSVGRDIECQKPVRILQTLMHSGYGLYTLEAVSHPKAPDDAPMQLIRAVTTGAGGQKYCPVMICDSIACGSTGLERKYSGGDGKVRTREGDMYQIGYWTDIVAIRQGFK